jgi:Spy/CpxP family protein refolding chaperone
MKSKTLLVFVLLSEVFGSVELNAQTATNHSGNAQFLGRDLAGNGRLQAYERILRVLTDEQRSSLREAIFAQREKSRSLEQQIGEARREIFESALVDKFDEQTVRKKLMAAAKMETDLSVIRFKAFSEMKPPLSAKQLDQIRSSSEAAAKPSEGAPAGKRKRPEIPRDENGLPLKDQPAPRQ